MTLPERVNKTGLNKGNVVGLDKAQSTEHGFKVVQQRVLKELKKKTEVGKIGELELSDLAMILRTCRENLTAIHTRKLNAVAGNQITFVTSAPVRKKGTDAED